MSKLKTTPSEIIHNWQAILWREWYKCNDPDYAERLYKAAYGGLLSWFQRMSLKNQPRPYAGEVEAALRTACTQRGGAKFVWQERLAELDHEKEKPILISVLIARLSDHHWWERFVARHVLFHRGGEAIGSLASRAVTDTGEVGEEARWLVKSIGADTTKRLAKKAERLLCPTCLVHFHRHQLPLFAERDITYYGCRLCRQSHRIWGSDKVVVVVLDNRVGPRQVETEDQLRVNWFQHQALFDFDQVEIVAASDEQVERFAVKVGNDTDPIRKSYYQSMACSIDATCNLSENTVRVLDNIFGEVSL